MNGTCVGCTITRQACWLIRAEGVVGIARAFLRAGARFVIASLWQIDDEATLEREH